MEHLHFIRDTHKSTSKMKSRERDTYIYLTTQAFQAVSAQTLALTHTSYHFYFWTSAPSLAKGSCPRARHNPRHVWGAVPRAKKKAKCSGICFLLGNNSVSSLSLGC